MKKEFDDIDQQLRATLKRELPRERSDKWFVKKVMNRLPDKRRPTYSKPELISYGLSILILISGWLWLWNQFDNEVKLTYNLLAIYGTLLAMTLVVSGAMIYPIVRRD